MNVNEKGVIGLIEVIRDLTKKGYECFTPIHDYSAVDLIAIKGCDTYRLQVKYRTLSRGSILVDLFSKVNGKSVPIDCNVIDGWAVYCPEVDSVVYVSKHEVDTTKNSIGFKLTEGKNSVNHDKVKRKFYKEFGELAEWPKAAVC
jgi:hypothetical protein